MTVELEDTLGFRKCVHLKLMSGTHAGLRIALFKKKLSIQEVMEELSVRIAADDPVLMKILDEIVEIKRHKKVRELLGSDAESILDLIERTGQLHENE